MKTGDRVDKVIQFKRIEMNLFLSTTHISSLTDMFQLVSAISFVSDLFSYFLVEAVSWGKDPEAAWERACELIEKGS